MMHTVQFTATSPLSLAPSRTIPLVAAAKNLLSMTMGTSRFAGSFSKTSAPVAAKAVAPKASWNRGLDFNGNNTKTSPPENKGWVRHNKRRVPRAQAPTRNSGPCNSPASTGLRAAPAVAAVAAAPATPSGSPNKAMPLCPTAPVFVPRPTAAVVTSSPTPSAPSSPTTSADSSEPPADSWKDNTIYLQRLFKEGLKKEEIAKQTAAEFPDLCKGLRNGCKPATEETSVEAVGDAVFMHTRRYAAWYV